MPSIKEIVQSADWKLEKHVPAIEVPTAIKKGEFFKVTVTVGKQIPHPNKAEHHIGWISLYFHPDGEKFPYQISRTEFTSHGASTQGQDASTVYTHPEAVISFKTDKPGAIYAVSYCNIHGIWESSQRVAV